MHDRKIVETLAVDLQHPEPEERQEALDRLADLAPPDAVERIAPMLADPELDVRIEAMACLRDLRQPAALPHLLRAARSAQDPRERDHAVSSLDGFTGPEVRRCLLDALGGGTLSNVGRMKVARQLWRYPDEEAAEVLKSLLLGDPDRNVRSHAADSLAFVFRTLGRPKEWAEMWRAAQDLGETGVSRFASECLRQIAAGDSGD